MAAHHAFAAMCFLPLVLPIGIWVAWSDLSSMKIPNKAVLALLGVFLVIGVFVLPLTDFAWRWSHFAVALGIGFVLSSLNLIGAGDAKFAAAAAPFVALSDWLLISQIFAVCVIASFILHRLARISPLRKRVPEWESWENTRMFPMGVPLALALVIYLVIVAFG